MQQNYVLSVFDNTKYMLILISGPTSTNFYDHATGPAAKVRPVRPWPYRFLREKKWRHLDSNLRMRYGVASPSSSP